MLDVGASTGGFTDCALQAGAADVTCVDVGRSQLHARLRADPRVTSLEKINARHLQPGDLPRADYDAVVMDLSFISLKAVLPAVWPFLRPGGLLIALVKPQFEAGKAEADKGRGVIRDPAVQAAALDERHGVRPARTARRALLSARWTPPSPAPTATGSSCWGCGRRLEVPPPCSPRGAMPAPG